MLAPFFGFEIEKNFILGSCQILYHFLDRLCKISAILGGGGGGVMKSELFFGSDSIFVLNNPSLILKK